MEGLVWRTNHKSFSFCFLLLLLLLLLLHARVSSHLCTLSSHSHFLSLLLSSSSPPSEKKSRFWELSILIEIINPFYSFPDFHFVRSIIEEKEAIESCVQWHLDVGWWWWWWWGGKSVQQSDVAGSVGSLKTICCARLRARATDCDKQAELYSNKRWRRGVGVMFSPPPPDTLISVWPATRLTANF